MFELTNEQRKCFGLLPVDRNWTRIEPKSSPYDQHTTISYLDGTVLRKFIETGDNKYTEYEICERLSDDLRYLLPKTGKGKPVLLSAAALKNVPGLGCAFPMYVTAMAAPILTFLITLLRKAIIPAIMNQFAPTENMIFSNGWRTGATKPREMT